MSSSSLQPDARAGGEDSGRRKDDHSTITCDSPARLPRPTDEADRGGQPSPHRYTNAVAAVAYASLGSILALTRLTGLDGGFCCDEIATVVDYVREGPGKILAGSYAPNNHELFSLAGWLTSSVFGESETALRLWSAIPFIAGVAVATAWLQVRLNPLSGILFLFFATASPLLLDISRQARGYGLAFLAMSVLIVAALEAERTGRTLAIVAFCVAGLVGTWTLPHFAIAFVATAVVLIARPRLRARCAAGLAISIVAIAAWYAPHFDAIAESSLQSYGVSIDTAWLVTAPVDQTLVPALTLLDDAFLRPTLASLVAVVAFGALMASGPLLRSRADGLILGSGVVATVVVFWASGTHVVPRFFSFLLVPLFVLVATGTASILARLTTRPAKIRTVVAVATLGVVAFLSVPFLTQVPRVPRESLREAATVIRELAPPSTPVLAYLPYSADLAFHLGRPVERLRTQAQVSGVCRARGETVFVAQPFLMPPVTLPCMTRSGTRQFRFEQYARGRKVDVWFVPPAS